MAGYYNRTLRVCKKKTFITVRQKFVEYSILPILISDPFLLVNLDLLRQEVMHDSPQPKPFPPGERGQTNR